MRLFRIARAKHLHDLTGVGARIYGGRWNEKGVGVIYTSQSRALAALEFLVHVPMSLTPGDLRIICFDVPERLAPRALDVALLPGNWRDYPPPPELAAMGTQWVHAGESLLLRVPSAIVEHEFNVLINPAHPDFKSVKLSPPERFVFDRRILGRSR